MNTRGSRHLHFAALAWAASSLLASEATIQTRARNDGTPPFRVPEGVKAHRDLAYVEAGHARQKLDLYVPARAGTPLPVVIWIHGGAWAAGSKNQCPPLRQGFTERGYAVASIGYRLSGDAVFPAQIEDCKAALCWLRTHAQQFNLDPNRFGVWGSSAGGHLVALLGTSGDVKEFDVGPHLDQSSRVQAVCDYFGPTDLLQMDAHALPGTRLKHDPATSPESRLIGGPVQENKEKAARANPIVYVTPDDPPFLIVHGDQDPLVPIHQSRLLFDALKQAGVSVRFHTIQGAGHGPGFGGRQIDEMVSSFFDRCLKSTAAPARGAEQTESDASTGSRPTAKPVPPGARLSWEQVRTREGVDADGRVPREKFKGPPQLFDWLDHNRDGVLTKDDFDPPKSAAREPNVVLIVADGKARIKTVAVLLFEGVELMDFAGPAEVFIVSAEGQAFRVVTVAESTKPLKTMGGITVTPEFDCATAPQVDILIVPGGNLKSVGPVGRDWVKKTAQRAEITMSVCFGAFLLADAGLLDGIEATTHHWGIERLRKAAPKCKVVEGKRFVDAGPIITTAGVTAGIDGALHIVERVLGKEAARWTADQWMEHPRK